MEEGAAGTSAVSVRGQDKGHALHGYSGEGQLPARFQGIQLEA
jgi:hypothetical protein